MFTRRRILGTAIAAASTLMTSRVAFAAPRPFKAMAFDAFPVFDPRPVAALTEKLFPGHGTALINAWRSRQFEYSWLRTASGSYSDFMHVTSDALVFATNLLKLELTNDKRDRLLGAYLQLTPWPDAVPALQQLKAAGIRLAFLSNFTPDMLRGCIAASGLDGVFDHVLSTDQAKTYKPDPAAYRLGIDTFGLPREDILFVAFAGWDAAGARTFGYPTFWVNRLGLPVEELGVRPDATGTNLTDLAAYVTGK